MPKNEERTVMKTVTISSNQRIEELGFGFWMEKKEEEWLVQISIADLTNFIPYGSSLERTACGYALGKLLWPKEILEKSCFRAGQRVPAITIEISIFEEKFQRTIEWYTGQCKVFLSEAECVGNLKAEEIETIFRDTSHHFYSFFQKCLEVVKILSALRKKEGALVFYAPDSGLLITEEGDLVSAQFADYLLQELRILVNKETTVFLRNRNSSLIYRKQDEALSRITEIQEKIEAGARDDENFSTLYAITGLVSPGYYSAKPGNHFAQNLNRYAPVALSYESFADFVNLRILKAQLQKLKVPYTQEELAEIVRQVNAVEEQIRKRVVQEKHSLAVQEAERLIQLGDFRNMPGEAWHYLIQIICQEVMMSEKLAAALIVQIKAGQLQIVDLYNLLFSGYGPGPKSIRETWQMIRGQILLYCLDAPSVLQAIYKTACEKWGWSKGPDFTVVKLDEDHPIFQATATFNIQDKVYAAGPKTAFTEEEAECLVLVHLIAQIVGANIDFELIQQDRISWAVFDEPDYDFIAELLRYCRDHGYTRPFYRVVVYGPGYPHTPDYATQVVIQKEDFSYISDPCCASRYRRSKNLAAQNMLFILGERNPLDYREWQLTAPSLPDYVSRLQNYVEQQHLLPFWERKHACLDLKKQPYKILGKVTVVLHNGKVLHTRAIGSEHKRALKKAAKDMLDKLKIPVST